MVTLRVTYHRASIVRVQASQAPTHLRHFRGDGGRHGDARGHNLVIPSLPLGLHNRARRARWRLLRRGPLHELAHRRCRPCGPTSPAQARAPLSCLTMSMLCNTTICRLIGAQARRMELEYRGRAWPGFLVRSADRGWSNLDGHASSHCLSWPFIACCRSITKKRKIKQQEVE